MLLKAMLDRYIPDVRFVHSIQNCREALLTDRPDVIFIDNNLPDGKGVAYIKELKASLTDVRVIMISAMAGLKAQAYEFGADVFVEKPLTEFNVQKALETQ
jgi:CheY-like chemotaxis protein